MTDTSLPAQLGADAAETTTNSHRLGHGARVAGDTTGSLPLEDGQAIDVGSAVPLSLQAGRGVGRGRFQTMPEETLLEIFSYLTQPGLCAVAPLNQTFFRLSIPLLYRKLVGKFTAPAATRLFVTCVKRRNFPVHTRVLDGLAVAGQMPPEHLNLFAGALINMPNLEVLTLPPHVTERHLIDPGTNVRILRIKGPCIPHAFIARLQLLRALRFGRACTPAAADVLRIGAGPPLDFVHCPYAVATYFLPPAPLDRRVLGPRCVMTVFASSREEPSPAQIRAFLEALASTCCPPHTLCLDRNIVPHIARQLKGDRSLRVSRVSRLQIEADVSTPQKKHLCTQYVAALLHCFVHIETLELSAIPRLLPAATRFWSNGSVSLAMRARRAPLRLILYSQQGVSEFEPKHGWVVLRPPLLLPPARQKDPFAAASLNF